MVYLCLIFHRLKLPSKGTKCFWVQLETFFVNEIHQFTAHMDMVFRKETSLSGEKRKFLVNQCQTPHTFRRWHWDEAKSYNFPLIFGEISKWDYWWKFFVCSLGKKITLKISSKLHQRIEFIKLLNQSNFSHSLQASIFNPHSDKCEKYISAKHY